MPYYGRFHRQNIPSGIMQEGSAVRAEILKVTANTGNVALRVPNAKIPLAVVVAAAIPITATSANLSGASECTSADQVRDLLQGRISIIVDGGTSPRDVASTIVDLTDEGARWRIIREGAIPSDDISTFFAKG